MTLEEIQVADHVKHNHLIENTVFRKDRVRNQERPQYHIKETLEHLSDKNTSSAPTCKNSGGRFCVYYVPRSSLERIAFCNVT